MEKKTYDIAILGGGPAGVDAAVRASQLGMSVVVVERGDIGGTCLNRGCIPTKALLKCAEVLRVVKEAAAFGVAASAPVVDFTKVMARRSEVVAGLRTGAEFLLNKYRIAVVRGSGRIAAQCRIVVETADGKQEVVEARRVILATGAYPRSIAACPINEEYIVSSEGALSLTALPKSILVVGSGAVGCEFAYFFAALGVRTTIVEMADAIAPACDSDVSRQLDYSFRRMGMTVLTSVKSMVVERQDGVCCTRVQSRKGDSTIESDIVMSAVGVQPNVEGIGLEELGVMMENGAVRVDNSYSTNLPWLYAVGDVSGVPSLAHAASAEARLCVERIAGIAVPDINYDAMPACIYVHPEVACVGLTEQAARQRGMVVRVGKEMFAASGKARAVAARDGFVKLIFDADTMQLVGAHCVGSGTTEMLCELTMAIALHLTAQQMQCVVHAHPTMSETIVEAVRECMMSVELKQS